MSALITVHEKEWDKLEAEIKHLTAALATANKNHEHFEREWYLRGDRIAKLEAVLREIASPTDGFGYSEDLRKIATAALQEVSDE